MECWLYWQYYLYNNHAFNAQFSLALTAESYSRSKMFDQFIRFILSVACAKEEECLSNNFKCRTHARLLYVLRFGDQSVASKSAGGDPHGDILGHVPREILSDIYAKVPTNVCRWMDPRSGGGVASTSSARLCGILRRLPIAPSWGNPVATEPHLLAPSLRSRGAILD